VSLLQQAVEAVMEKVLELVVELERDPVLFQVPLHTLLS
jgi:hypothetical protein